MTKISFYYSAMNAGKTTALLQLNHNYNEQGMKTILFTPVFDNRYGEDIIQSRIGLKHAAKSYDKNTDFYSIARDVSCIFVDEAQFLSRQQVLDLAKVSDNFKIPICCYGLRTDFKGELFEGSKYLLAIADELIEIKTICHCGAKATMNARIDNSKNIVREGEQIEIGGNEMYVSLCRKHWWPKTSLTQQIRASLAQDSTIDESILAEYDFQNIAIVKNPSR